MKKNPAICFVAANCILALLIGLLPAFAAPKGEPAKPVVQPAGKPQGDWRAILKTTEQLIMKRDPIQAATYYVAAVQGAEAARISCSDPMFLQLMAVGKELSVTAPTIHPPNPQANAAVEAALKWKVHAANSVCGKDSPADYEALETMCCFYMMVNPRVALEYQEKASQMLAKLITSGKYGEVQKFQKAGKDRATRYIGVQFDKVNKDLDELVKKSQQIK